MLFGCVFLQSLSFPRLAMKSLFVLLICFILGSHCAIYYMVQDEVPVASGADENGIEVDGNIARALSLGTPDIGHENQCYDDIDNIFRNPRELMRSENGTCSRVTCLGRYEADKVIVEKATCGVVMVMPGCELVEDLSLPYPECCPRIVCPDLDNDISSVL